MESKAEIRKKMEFLRSKLTEEQKQSMDLSIYNKVVNHSIYTKSKSIFIYVSYKNEVDTHEIIKHALSCGKAVAVPVIIEGRREFAAIKIDDFQGLKRNRYGILEPEFEQNNVVDANEFDLSFIPGTAFDNLCGRVGYGAGMYDKYFSNKEIHSYKLALAYDFQVLNEVPMDVFDLKVDEIITE